ncbi:hypothetical protein J0X19_22320 [Hymenobacter sp. BT186]|uniref:Uncharacterized protein n=1 Tax=Hymenobacter telluris TaxID=2816474 RepID=A0A939F3H9_9BACT|nr:hypothetical protein [Hymenobacter telluris]MBO0360713.1 hypothetical protein [Hymenobacter telluris]MBW3376740.1 hypothetical protein [Hymenobacter norwichensis]
MHFALIIHNVAEMNAKWSPQGKRQFLPVDVDCLASEWIRAGGQPDFAIDPAAGFIKAGLSEDRR